VRRRGSILTLVIAVGFPSFAWAQTRVITGTVTVAGGAVPVAGARVSAEGTTMETVTGNEGNYRLTVPAGDVRLIARAIGYKRSTQLVNATQTTASFALERDVLQIEGVVVTGQATTIDRRSATTAVAMVSGDAVNAVPAPTIQNALVGRVSGVNLQSNSGAPGGGIQMQVRGNNTILGSFDPLYVVDGVPYSNTRIASGRGTISAAAFATAEDDAVDRVADINPANIESIEIMKGAAASSIYGSRAANGVVIIKTKRGQAGAPNVSLRQRVGFYDISKTLESRRWTLAEATDPDMYGPQVAHWFDDNPSPYYNHFDQVFDNNKPSYETALDVSGGTATTRYFIGGTWKRDEGIERKTGFGRQNLRVNVDQSLGGKIEAQVSTVFNRAEHDRGWNNNCNNYACHGYAFAYTPSFVNLKQRNENGNFPVPDWGIQANSIQTTELARNHEETTRFTGGISTNYDAINTGSHSLRFVGAVGLDAFSQNNDLWSPNELFFEATQTLPGSAIEGVGTSRIFNWNLNGIHNFVPSGSGWSLNTSFGTQFVEEYLNVSRITTTNLVPGQQNVGQGTNTTGTENLTKSRTIALYGQEEVRLFGERLLLQGGLRAERTSNNGDIDKWFIFPKVSGSYRIVNLIGTGSEIKPRIAYGETGNLPVFGQKFTLLNTPQLSGLNGFTVAGAAGSPIVEPERVKEIEVGIDGLALDGRLTWELTGFSRNTTNLLLQRVPAPSTGFATQVFNGGKIANRGFEAVLGVTPVQRQNLTWISRGTFTQYTSEVKDLAGLPPFRPPLSGFGGLGVTFIEVGEPLTQIIGRDFDANGERTATDVRLGNTAPDFKMGFVNDLTFKALTFNVVFDYQKGGDIINLTQFLYDDAQTSHDYGSPDWEYRMRGYDEGVMTPYIEDATYLKLREVSIGVAIPTRFLGFTNLPISSARINLAGRNLVSWQKYSGLDPEVANLGSAAIRNNLDVAAYPPSRSFFLDISLGF
jgi:TonB-linked SusC/RagA family outer membrane protein